MRTIYTIQASEYGNERKWDAKTYFTAFQDDGWEPIMSQLQNPSLTHINGTAAAGPHTHILGLNILGWWIERKRFRSGFGFYADDIVGKPQDFHLEMWARGAIFSFCITLFYTELGGGGIPMSNQTDTKHLWISRKRTCVCVCVGDQKIERERARDSLGWGPHEVMKRKYFDLNAGIPSQLRRPTSIWNSCNTLKTNCISNQN